MLRTGKKWMLVGLLAGTWLPATIVCDVPDVVRVVDRSFFHDDFVIIDDGFCCDDDLFIDIEIDD